MGAGFRRNDRMDSAARSQIKNRIARLIGSQRCERSCCSPNPHHMIGGVAGALERAAIRSQPNNAVAAFYWNDLELGALSVLYFFEQLRNIVTTCGNGFGKGECKVVVTQRIANPPQPNQRTNLAPGAARSEFRRHGLIARQGRERPRTQLCRDAFRGEIAQIGAQLIKKRKFFMPLLCRANRRGLNPDFDEGTS